MLKQKLATLLGLIIIVITICACSNHSNDQPTVEVDRYSQALEKGKEFFSDQLYRSALNAFDTALGYKNNEADAQKWRTRTIERICAGEAKDTYQAINIELSCLESTTTIIAPTELETNSDAQMEDTKDINATEFSVSLEKVMGPDSYFGWIRVHFIINNPTDSILTLYKDDFVLHKEGEQSISQTSYSSGFAANGNTYTASQVRLLPGDSIKASLDFSARDVVSSEGYVLSYIKGNTLLSAITLPEGEIWVDQ